VESVKLCINCKFAVNYSTSGNADSTSYICEKSSNVNLVTGSTNTVERMCLVMRSNGGECGPEGRLYEPKE